MAKAKGKATKTTFNDGPLTLNDLKTHDGPFYVTGNNIKELSSFISGLPGDITIALEDKPHSAVPIAFDRVVPVENPRGESEHIALFHIVNRELLDKIKADAAAGKLPRLDSIRRTTKTDAQAQTNLQNAIQGNVYALVRFGVSYEDVLSMVKEAWDMGQPKAAAAGK